MASIFKLGVWFGDFPGLMLKVYGYLFFFNELAALSSVFGDLKTPAPNGMVSKKNDKTFYRNISWRIVTIGW